jgi:hypothetical protein
MMDVVLDGRFGNAEFSSNLFIRTPLLQQREYLLLAPSEDSIEVVRSGTAALMCCLAK